MKIKIVLIFVLILYFCSCVNGPVKQRTKELEFRGKISKIYNDTKNHYMYTFNILTEGGEISEVAEFWPNSWEYASVGDSIIKPKDELKIIIKKPDGSWDVFFYR
jgi:hypothetical protein